MSHGWKNSATWTVSLYLDNDPITQASTRAMVLRAYQNAYIDAIAEPATNHPATLIDDAQAIARVVAGDTLGDWVRRSVDKFAPFAILGCNDRVALAYTNQFGAIARAAVESLLNECDYREIAVHYIDRDTRECELAARQLGDCAGIPAALTWTRHAEHMAINATWLGYDRAALVAMAEKITRERDMVQVDGSAVHRATDRMRNNAARRGVTLPRYNGNMAHIDADGYWHRNLFDLSAEERAEYMSGAKYLDDFKIRVAIDGKPIDRHTVQVAQ